MKWPTRARSTACSPRSAARNWSVQPPSSTPTPSTGRVPHPDRFMLKLLSFAVFIGAWMLGSYLAGERLLPRPDVVVKTITAEVQSGTLLFALGVTLARVFLAFVLAMLAGTAIGLAMGRITWADAIGDPWLVVLLNLPALIVIVLAYVWGG